MMERSTRKIALWVQNDQGLYDMARECHDGEGLENQFIELCEMSPEFAMQILLDLLGPVDFDEVWESVQD